MPIPLVLWGVAGLLAATGVVKGVGAMSDFDDAKTIGENARERHTKAEAKVKRDRDQTNKAFEKLGRTKLAIFNDQIHHLVEVIKRTKSAKSTLRDFNVSITVTELKEMERVVLRSLEIEQGLGAGAATGVLAAMGAYGSVGFLATASTTTAISSLSGAAATSATLAWLGGGTVASGGALSFGMYGGAIALGGIVLGPALAVGGFMLAGKAEEALTQATAYQAKADLAIAEMDKIKVALAALRANAKELSNTITSVSRRFDEIKVDDDSDEEAFANMVILGKGLKNLLDIAIMDDAGAAVPNLKALMSGTAELS